MRVRLRVGVTFLASLLAAAALTVLAPTPATATTDDDQFATITIETVEPVSWQNGRSVAAVVSLAAERPISGQLVVIDRPDGDNAQTRWEYDLDLAAGSSVEVPVLLTTGWNGVSVVAEFESNGERVARETFSDFPDGGFNQVQGLVGLLGVDERVAFVSEIGSDARLATLELDRSLDGLSRVTSIVADPVAVRELAAGPGGVALQSWIQHGGQLVVEGRPGSLGSGFEDRPTANPNRFTYGTGSILFEPNWQAGIPLGGTVGAAGLEGLVQTQDLGIGSGAELGLLAGLQLPPSWLIAVVLLVYAVVAGPVLFGFAQGRRSPGLIWVTLPILSLGLAAVILGVGFLSRTGRSSAHVTIVEVAADEGSRATTDLLLVSRLGGEQVVEVGSEWDFLGQGRDVSRRNLVLRPSATDLDVAANLPAGGTALLRFEGSAPRYDGALTVDQIESTRNDDGQREVSAVVANNSDVDLFHVVAFLGNERLAIDDLPSGASQRFTITADEDETRTMGELLIWPRTDRRWVQRDFNEAELAVPRDPDAPTAAGAWTAWRVEQGSSAVGPNTLGVAGWTQDLPSPLEGIETGRTALFAREELDGMVDPARYFSGTYRLHDMRDEPDFFGQEGFPVWVQDYRFTLGSSADPELLAIRLDRASAGLAFWTADGWRFVENLPDREGVVLALPAEALIDGEVQLRSWISDFQWDAGVTVTMATQPDEVEGALQADLVEGETFRSGAMEFDGPPIDVFMQEQIVLERTVNSDGTLEPLDEESVNDFIEQSGFISLLVEVEAGETLRVTMRSNNDSYLEVWPELGPMESNDDFGQGLDSRVEIAFAEAQMVEIRASGLGNGEATAVSVRVEVGP
jgi:hypothetical protein